MSEQCKPEHDWFAGFLTFGLVLGLLFSYTPQHFRIINKNSSEGFSPWFLLLGATSSASAVLNMITMQWGVVKCCKVFSVGTCLEMTAGVFQVFLQWFLFNVILVLYMIYYPNHLKYVDDGMGDCDQRPLQHTKSPKKNSEWALSIILSWVVFMHLLFSIIITFFLLLTEPSTHDAPLSPRILSWATFLGVTSALLAAIQYIPQFKHTFQAKVVGALSIPMMIIQTPGAAVMVLSIALRPGTNWTSWIVYAVSGIMQGSLLIMCIVWKIRQNKLGIDDFGNPVVSIHDRPGPIVSYSDNEDLVPGLVTDEGDNPNEVRQALAVALEDAVASDLRTPSNHSDSEDESTVTAEVGERTPLVNPAKTENRGWFGWFGR